MFFFFTCGTHTFSSPLKNPQGTPITTPLLCQNCGNQSGRLLKRWQWFTFCFVPVIPFSIKPYHEVGCHVCNFFQDVKYRNDVQGLIGGHAPQQQQHQGGSELGKFAHGAQQQQQHQQYPQGQPPQYAQQPQQHGYGPPPAGVPHQQPQYQ